MPPTPRLPQLAWLAIGCVAAGWLWLRRDPSRYPPDEAGVILSPADGKVLLVERGPSPGWVAGPAWRLAIYLSLFDVHVQRAPVAGHVRFSERRRGGHRLAYEPGAAVNAGHTLGLENGQGRVLVIRSAGAIARRVTTCVHEGDELAAGQRIGSIILGSRTEVYLPCSAAVCVRAGDAVRAGETILARWEGSHAD